MPAIFSKNCILMGKNGYCCVACSFYLASEDDALSHVQGSKHKHRCESIGYLEKHKQDLIRKINDLYFCEVCNVTLSTAVEVTFHVREEAHLAAKCVRELKRERKSIMIGDVTLSETAWHGLVEDSCVLCNIKFDNVSAHKREMRHVINLINNNVIIGVNDNIIYRKVGSLCQCLTCNKVVPSEQSLTEHLTSEEHQRTFEEHRKSQNKTINSSDKLNINVQDEKSATTINASKGVQLHRIDRTTNLIEDYSTFVTKTIFNRLAKKYGLTIKGDKFVYCNVCHKQIEANSYKINQHVLSVKHKYNTPDWSEDEYQMPPTNPDLDMFVRYTDKWLIVNTLNASYIIINDSVCVSLSSFIYISTFRNKRLCSFCYAELKQDDILKHINKQHSEEIKFYLLFSEKNNEIVRRLPDELYNCMYCDIIVSEIEDMFDHLATPEHLSSKEQHEKMLLDFKVQLAKDRQHSTPDYSDAEKKVLTKNYVKTWRLVNNYLIINDSTFVSASRFIGTMKEDETLCRFCLSSEIGHFSTEAHLAVLENSRVITSVENELVREIKPDLYDCAYCGITKSDFNDMLDHLATPEHKKLKMEFKDKAKECLQYSGHLNLVDILKRPNMLSYYY